MKLYRVNLYSQSLQLTMNNFAVFVGVFFSRMRCNIQLYITLVCTSL